MRKKRGHLLLSGKVHCGEVLVANIGIPNEIMQRMHPNVWENDPALWLPVFPDVKSDSHKYSRGHSIVFGGGIAQTGAAKLAARAALRSGAGLVSVACDDESLPVYATSFSSIITKPISSAEAFCKLVEDVRVTSIIIGPGAGINEHTRQCVLSALRMGKKMVIDADAISAFAETPEILFNQLSSDSVLTPHEGEFERLFKLEVGAASKLERAKYAAKLSNATILLKGADTVIASPDGRAVINANASPDLATAGSGDVLSGICGGLMAQGMPTFEAVCAAVWMHGFASVSIGAGLIAEDLTEAIPPTVKMLRELKG
jgi:NAD(P)H-hydrate epimerase